ncbi:hypothetical protein [Loktanella sp. Alg231-35]|uniref:hypothetical protein n=1 Tax=Loktanella sp. Alg231-35 TaxID=1922220 RepID=UPI000D55A29A|nr:hypothetical protein [Loktanella sp. Alg231-35]
MDTVDLVVLDERVEGQLTHAIALSGERKNPYQSAIMLTDRPGADSDDLYDLIPSLYALVGTDVKANMLGKLAFSAVSNLDMIASRVDRQIAAEKAELDLIEPAEIAVEETAADALFLDAAMLVTPDDDGESGAPACADIAIVAPAMAEIAAAGTVPLEKIPDVVIAEAVTAPTEVAPLEKVEDAVMAEVAALFRSHPLSHLAGGQRPAAAQAQAS